MEDIYDEFQPAEEQLQKFSQAEKTDYADFYRAYAAYQVCLSVSVDLSVSVSVSVSVSLCFCLCFCFCLCLCLCLYLEGED